MYLKTISPKQNNWTETRGGFKMKPQFSNHALQRMENRNISKEIVLKVIGSPDSVSLQNDSVVVYSKIVEIDSKTYLYRVFVNNERIPPLIITAYKTSKFEKYGN